MSAIKKTTIAANGFYWRSALKLSGAPSFKGLGTADPQSSLWEFNMHDNDYYGRHGLPYVHVFVYFVGAAEVFREYNCRK